MNPKGSPQEWTAIRVSRSTQRKLQEAAQALQLGKLDSRTGEFTGPSMNDVVRVVSQTILDARRKLGFS